MPILFLALPVWVGGCFTTHSSDPMQPHPLVDPPASWTAALRPAGEVLRRADLTCEGGGTRIAWRKDLSFEMATPRAKFGGTWRFVDGDIIYLTDGPVGEPRCTAARFLGDPVEALLCGEGVIGCGSDLAWAIEVIDAGAGEAAQQLVGRALSAVEPGYGEGVVFKGGSAPSRVQGVAVHYRLPVQGGAGPRELAEHVADVLDRDLETGPVTVQQDRDATSPIVVLVGGTVAEIPP
ncbi:MAG TPA: hypothetical protein ENK18_01760 [Deltaproteobacteria bacterium]|nr:hypothetical protein [Deltaproteobacteria bacterium]